MRSVLVLLKRFERKGTFYCKGLQYESAFINAQQAIDKEDTCNQSYPKTTILS